MQLQQGLPTVGGAPWKNGELAATDALGAVKTALGRGVDPLHSGLESARKAAAALLGTEQDIDKLPASTDAVQQEKIELPLIPLGAHKPHVANDASQTGKGRLAAEEHANKLIHADSRMAQSSALPQMVLAAGIGEPGVRQTERVAERSALKQIGGSEGGLWGYQALVEAGRIDPPSSITGASVLSPEMMVAEQVNYWIGRDVQNAEIKLDGLGESPVQVSISLQGNEAHIEFRTDQAETRQVLEGAVSHLKDLLGSEGLVLSSVSVGSSASRGDDPRERKPAEQSRQAAVKVPEALAGGAALRPARLTGRTVDLFV
jgi:flagellar hook-length control protein FliK